jgi:hypothetical protein
VRHFIEKAREAEARAQALEAEIEALKNPGKKNEPAAVVDPPF